MTILHRTISYLLTKYTLCSIHFIYLPLVKHLKCLNIKEKKVIKNALFVLFKTK